MSDDVTEQVLASFDGAPPRLRELLRSLVEHAHAFVRETRLTEEEWAAGVEFLTRCGHITDDRRQEFVLLSDVLGLSMLTIGVNAPPAGTEATVLGPFFVEGSPEIPPGGSIGGSGVPCHVRGSVRSVDGAPVPGARLEIWEADDAGLYDVQRGEALTGRGHLFADDEGEYHFWAVTPTPYPIPSDGPVGDLLAATGRGPMRAPHLHFLVTAPGFHRLVTHIFVRGGEHIDDDAVFGVKQSLVADFTDHPAGSPAPDGTTPSHPWTSTHFDIVLAPEADAPPDPDIAGP